MKARYEAPKMKQEASETIQLFSSSTTTRDVYTDSPVTPGQALVKEHNSIWDDEW